MDINGLKFWIIGFKKDTTPLSDYIKNKGGKIPNAANMTKANTDIIIINPNVLFYSRLYKSAIYQKKTNGKLLLTVQEFKEEMNDPEFPDVDGLDEIYDLSSDEAKAKSIKQISDDLWGYLNNNWDLQFNDTFYEFISYSDVDFKLTQEQIKLLVDAGVYEEALIKLNNEKNVDEHKVREACGGWGCFYRMMQIFLTIKYFIDEDFECNFRIYRDKWEERGDYPGMCAHPREVPPALYWKINSENIYGFLETVPYKWM